MLVGAAPQSLVRAGRCKWPPTHRLWFLSASRNALPTGEDGQAGARHLLEAQMVLHASAVNERRESRGALPVNSLWLWGGGSAPLVRSGTLRKC